MRPSELRPTPRAPPSAPPQLYPGTWSHVNLRKALLPRLASLLRHGCYGSAPASLPALLPLLRLLPEGALGPQPGPLVGLLEALWAGLASGPGASA